MKHYCIRLKKQKKGFIAETEIDPFHSHTTSNYLPSDFKRVQHHPTSRQSKAIFECKNMEITKREKEKRNLPEMKSEGGLYCI